ncbi:MAG: hypothetical protein HP049_04195, partial [Clostridiales bacterium]|nr:hypothetical protein [Clostridiales bacterium]
GNVETKIWETFSTDSVYPFRDGLISAEWGDAWVRIRYLGGSGLWRECTFALS